MTRRLAHLATPMLFCALATTGAQAQAQPALRSHLSADGHSLQLYPRERVTVRIAKSGLTLVSVAPARDEDAAPPKPGVRGPDAPMTLQAPAGTVAFILGKSGATATLKIESAMDQAFDYRAQVRASPTLGRVSVCTVLPQLAAYESWNRRVEAMSLSNFAPRPTNDVVCR